MTTGIVPREEGSDALYRWSNGRIVLFIEPEVASWVISRGWLTGDTLVDVRRWNMATERRVIGQFKRLIWDATLDDEVVATAVDSLRAWLSTHGRQTTR